MRHSYSRTARKYSGNWNWGNPNRRDPAAGQIQVLITIFLLGIGSVVRCAGILTLISRPLSNSNHAPKRIEFKSKCLNVTWMSFVIATIDWMGRRLIRLRQRETSIHCHETPDVFTSDNQSEATNKKKNRKKFVVATWRRHLMQQQTGK